MTGFEGLKGIIKEKNRTNEDLKILQNLLKVERKLFEEYFKLIPGNHGESLTHIVGLFVTRLIDENLDKKLITKERLEDYIQLQQGVVFKGYEFYPRGRFSGKLLEIVHENMNLINGKHSADCNVLYFDGKGAGFDSLFSGADVDTLILDNFSGMNICEGVNARRILFNNVNGYYSGRDLNQNKKSEIIAFNDCTQPTYFHQFKTKSDFYLVANSTAIAEYPIWGPSCNIHLAVLLNAMVFPEPGNGAGNGYKTYKKEVISSNRQSSKELVSVEVHCQKEIEYLASFFNGIRNSKKCTGLELAQIIFPIYDSLKTKGAFDG